MGFKTHKQSKHAIFGQHSVTQPILLYIVYMSAVPIMGNHLKPLLEGEDIGGSESAHLVAA